MHSPNQAPSWITDAMLPLPVGTERVTRDRIGDVRCHPVDCIWRGQSWGVSGFALSEEDIRQHWSPHEVWHVPAKEPAKGSAWERLCERRGIVHDTEYLMMEPHQFNEAVDAEVARAGKPRRPAREVAERCVLELKIHGVAMMTTERERDIAVQVVAAAIERDREEGAR